MTTSRSARGSPSACWMPDRWRLLIGGPDGLSESCNPRQSDLVLSPLTLPHGPGAGGTGRADLPSHEFAGRTPLSPRLKER
jgi:hypothetical protein